MELSDLLNPLNSYQVRVQTEVVEKARHDLWDNQDVMEYLHTVRGLTKETLDDFKIGVMDNPSCGFEEYGGMICIPYLGAGGTVLGIRFRCPNNHDCKALKHPKYMSMHKSATRMFNVRDIVAAKDTICIAEGEFDAMILSQIGFRAVAMPGVDTFKYRHAKMLGGFKKVYIFADPDEAGRKMTSTIMKYLPNARPVRLLEGDVTETFLNSGADGITKLMN